MRKIMLYALAAVILGISIMLVPLLTIKAEDPYGSFWFASESLRTPRGAYDTSAIKEPELEALAISFAVALCVYFVIKRRAPRDKYLWTWQYPF